MNGRSNRVLLVLSCLAGPAVAQVLHVPGDHEDLQAAIDAAAPGTTIVVAGGTHGPLSIDRPLAIVGDPAPLIVHDGVAAGSGLAVAPVTLEGPGAGLVVLAQVEVGGTVDGQVFGQAQAGILGGGFSDLLIFDSTIEGPRWVTLRGIGEGAPAIEVDVGQVLISRSRVRGADTGHDHCAGTGPPGPTGLLAPNATVTVLDSTVQGGGSDSICAFGYCPSGGAGGAGVEAAVLIHSGSTILGGIGADHWNREPAGPGSVYCGKAPDGVPHLAPVEVVLPIDLAALTRLAVGSDWTLAWDKGPAMFAAFTEHDLAPLALGVGLVFVDLVGPREIAFHAGGPQTHTVSIANDPNLVGLALTAQVHELGGAVSRPVTAVILP